MRLINADALKEVICANVYPVRDYFNSQDYGMFWTGGIEKAINEAPTIDAVEVVRCKDCKYSEYKQGELRCYIWSISSKTKEDGYCFCGAKMEAKDEDY